MRRTDPERDPLFRALVLAMAVALVVALAFDAVGRHRSSAEASSNTTATSATSSTSAMSHMGGGSMGSMSAQQMAVMHERSMKAFPAKTRGQGNQVLRPTVVNGVKVFHLMAMPVRWEMAPGQFATALAYNDQVPGPQIRVHRGDTVRVVLTNHLSQPTVIHWHGLTVPNAMDGVPYVTQDPVMPGRTFTYQFRVVDPPGTYLYHSHFNSTEQVGDGLYGAFVIEPNHTTWDVEYTEILNDGTLGFTIDGKGWPATAPLMAKLGQTVLIRMANVGQMLHPLHLHGYHFTVIAQDGAPVRPYSADTLVVAPGETYDVVVHATNPGVWALHCHILSHVEGPEGMFGMATALIIQ
jgi:manganese oxidase